MTNSEWIRSMPDEELASFMQPDMHVACYICDCCAALLGDLECQDCRTKDKVSILFNWLSKEHVPGEMIIEGVIRNECQGDQIESSHTKSGASKESMQHT